MRRFRSGPAPATLRAMRTLPLALLLACADAPEGVVHDSADLWADLDATADDLDQDGVPARDDCDDLDAGALPGGVEVCGDGVDQDCQGGPDDGCDGPDEGAGGEVCTGGEDEDGDEAVDCADPDCVLEPVCATCNRDYTAFCGMHMSSVSRFGGRNDVSGYAVGGQLGGSEMVFAFEPRDTTTYTFTFDPEDPTAGFGGFDVALVRMDGACRPDLASATVDDGARGRVEEMTFTVEAGAAIYVAVEKVGGTDEGFWASASCE